MLPLVPTLSIAVAFLFGLIGIYLSKIQSCTKSSYSLDWFLTARNSLSWMKLSFAFFAASTGSWVLFLPSQYASNPDLGSGLLILPLYALNAAYPILFIAYIGNVMKQKYPTVRSLIDFCARRFGKTVAIYVCCVSFINNAIVLVAEYTAIGKLFMFFDSSKALPIFAIGLITLMYTTAGGLSISIVLNKYQAILSFILILILGVYFWTIVDIQALPETTTDLSLTSLGASKLFGMLVSYQFLFVFTDAMWQRVLASESQKSLKIGAWVGAFFSMSVIFSIGLIGYLGYSTKMVVERTVSFVGIFNDGSPWISICVMTLGVCMNQALISSLQHSLTGIVMSFYRLLGYKDSLVYTKMTSIFLHVPFLLVGLMDLEITSIYKIANILTLSSALPILLGLVPRFDKVISSSSVLLGCAFSLMAVFTYGFFTTGCFMNGIFVFLFDKYSWEPFVLALFASLAGIGLCAIIELCSGQSYVPEITLNGQILPHHSYQSMETCDRNS